MRAENAAPVVSVRTVERDGVPASVEALRDTGLLDVCDCYVLDGGARVLSKNGVIRLLSGSARERGDLDTYIAALPSRYADLAVRANIEAPR